MIIENWSSGMGKLAVDPSSHVHGCCGGRVSFDLEVSSRGLPPWWPAVWDGSHRGYGRRGLAPGLVAARSGAAQPTRRRRSMEGSALL